MPQERKLLSQKNARAGISPQYGPGTKILKEITGVFLPDLAAAVTDGAIDGLVQSGFIRTFKEGAQVEQGDIGDLVGKIAKIIEITLTNQNFFLLYKKGFRSKQHKLIVLPLRYAKDVETQGIIGKEVRVAFEVPQEGKSKPLCFDLSLRVKHPETWIGAIEQAIREILPTPLEEKVLCSIKVSRRGRHALYLTQKRVIVARTTISWLSMALVLVSAVFGLFSLLAGIDAYMHPSESRALALTLFTIGSILVGGPLSIALSVMKRRFKKLGKSPPEDVLTANKKNFDIPYHDITRVEMKKGKIGFPHKIKIITDSEKHEFSIIGKKQLERDVGFIRSVLPDKVYVD